MISMDKKYRTRDGRGRVMADLPDDVRASMADVLFYLGCVEKPNSGVNRAARRVAEYLGMGNPGVLTDIIATDRSKGDSHET